MVLRWGGQQPRSFWGGCPGPLWLVLMLGLILIPTLTWGLDLSVSTPQYVDLQWLSRWSCGQHPMSGFTAEFASCSTRPTHLPLTRRRSHLPVQLLPVDSRAHTVSVLPALPQPVRLGPDLKLLVGTAISPHTESVLTGSLTGSSLDWQTDLRHLLHRPAVVKARVRRPLPELDEINDLLDTVLPYFDLEPTAIPRALRSNVSQRIHTYVVRHHRMIQAKLLRADMYLPMIKRAFLERGLPTYYAYLPLIESAFRPHVQHPVSGARGLWQFMGATAQMCGLEVSKQRDERLNPARATEAAAGYIGALRKRFGAVFPLRVLAAYNFGETNLARGMQRAQTDDIWVLYRRRLIPAETREYLLRMIAMWVIVAQPGRFQLLLAEAADAPPPVRRYESEDGTWLHVTQFVPQPGE